MDNTNPTGGLTPQSAVSPSEGPQQAGEMDKELSEIQRRQMQVPALEEECANTGYIILPIFIISLCFVSLLFCPHSSHN